jgi:hypothetical protein
VTSSTEEGARWKPVGAFPFGSLPLSISSIGGSSSRVRDLRRERHERVCARASAGDRWCAVLALEAPQCGVDRIPLHVALHCCAVVVRALLLGVCAMRLSLPSSGVPMYAAVGTESGMGMMLLQLSSSVDVGTARGGVRGVREPEQSREGWVRLACACRCTLPTRRSRIRAPASAGLFTLFYCLAYILY